MTRLDVLIASLLLIVASLSGCITEELVDDILGCMDENAANYEENATTELVGDCIYMATAETFMEAMTDVGSIEDILEDTPKAGYSQSISSSEWNQDLGMQMDVEIEDIVMADLNTDSVYVHNSISIAGLLQIEYTHVQVGEVVNIHLLMGGMMAQGDATQSVSQTRDATPNVLEVIAEQAGLFTGEDDDGEDDDGPVVSDGIPEDAVITIAMSDDMESQTMTMEYTEDGAEITTTIHIDQNQDLVSMSVESDNGSATSSLTYEVMWGDAIVIEVDDTLPRTSIPVWFDSEIFDDVNDHDDHGDDDSEEMFPCDGGNTWIPWDWVNDGYEDCEDGSDEYDDDGHDDDDEPPSPEDVLYMTDLDGDGNMSQEEFVTYWNNENPDAPIDSDQSFLTTEDVEDLIELCDYDAPSDLIDINEMQCFIDNLVGMMPDDENTPSLDDFFSHFDTDGDGHLTATEFIDAND
ncbi:MAG: EF-hand domain-containing protein, partial [Candidatus Thermoplasmatota archaeon]|nr:EF-hand domain-containing protein [Candidatus Thermoplasmatota archaeon]